MSRHYGNVSGYGEKLTSNQDDVELKTKILNVHLPGTEMDDCDEGEHLLPGRGQKQPSLRSSNAPAAQVPSQSQLQSAAHFQLQRACPLGPKWPSPVDMQPTVGTASDSNGLSIVLTPTTLNSATTTTMPAAAVTGSTPSYPAPQMDNSEYKGPKFWRTLVKNWDVISQPVALLAIFFGIWAIAHILLPDYASPHTTIMRIAFLFVGAQLAGILVTFIRLPDMLGMLFFGVLYTNIGMANFSGYERFEAFLREMALINIMLLAGLGLDEKAFKRLWLMILRLTLVPTIAEVAVIAVLANLLLHMPWLWGILLGLVVTAVSPNVVVTVMLKLREERLGLNNGIHTLIYAMTTCNDVVAIFLFGVMLGVIFSTGTLTEQILQGPIGIGIGVVFGYVYGLMLQFLPSKKAQYANGLRFVLTVVGGAVAVMGSKAIGYPSAGALGCVTVAFIAGMGWRRQHNQQPRNTESCTVPQRLDLLWKFLKPVSFALIGKEINFSVLDGRVVGYGILLVVLGSLLRLIFAYISTYGGNLPWRERAYITISGFPKATVQAALGPIALDLARSTGDNPENLALASNVLIISVLAIILTAPLGAILMLRLAPLWLQRSNDDSSSNVEEKNEPPTYEEENQENYFNNETSAKIQNHNNRELDTAAVSLALTVSASPSAEAAPTTPTAPAESAISATSEPTPGVAGKSPESDAEESRTGHRLV